MTWGYVTPLLRAWIRPRLCTIANLQSRLKIDGWVPASARGHAVGVGLSNTKAGYKYVVAFANDEAQYWGSADSSNSYAWGIYNVLPGTYTLTVYKEELEVYTVSIVITAGAGTAVHTITCVSISICLLLSSLRTFSENKRRLWALNYADTPC